MSIAAGDLLMLVRLLEDRLETADGVRVRERLAVEKELLIGWRTLARNLEQEISSDDLRAAKLVRPEQMAAFVEERLDPREAAHLEQTCWSHPALLREVVSVFRAVHGGGSETLPNLAVTQQAVQRMDEIVSQQCSANVSMPRHKNNGASSPSVVPQRSPADRRTTRRSRGDRSLPVLTRRNSTATARPDRRRLSAGLIAMTASLLLLLTGWFLFSGRSDPQQPDPGPIVDQPLAPPAPKGTPKHPGGTDDPSPIVKRPPNKQKQPGHPDRSGHPPAGIEWDSLTGIVAARRRDQDRWKGVRRLTGQKPLTQGPLIVRTLPGSRIEGRAPNRAGLILGGDSEVRVSIDGTDRLVFGLELRQGRIAVVNLDRGDQVRFRIGSRTWTVQSRSKKTAVGFTRQDGDGRTWDLLAWNGSVTVDAVNLSTGQSLRWDGESFGNPVMLSRQSDWRRDPQPQPVLTGAQIDRCNNSEDLTAALLDTAKRGDAGQRTTSLRMGFVLDPVTTVPAAVASTNPRQRTAAIKWLLAASESSPVTRRVWGGVEKAIGPGGKPVQLRRWFAAMRNGRKPQAADLGRLVRGLGPRQPLFVRQCSIHFLRQITRLPLAEYHPDQPTRAAVTSVSQKVRRAMGNANPRSRKGKVRPRTRKKTKGRRRSR